MRQALGASLSALLGKPWWPPFQERAAGLLVITAAAAGLFGWATLVTDYHAPSWLGGGAKVRAGNLSRADPATARRTGPDCMRLQSSKLWLCWLRLVLGYGLWSSGVLVRLQAMNQLYLHDAEPLWYRARRHALFCQPPLPASFVERDCKTVKRLCNPTNRGAPPTAPEKQPCAPICAGACAGTW